MQVVDYGIMVPELERLLLAGSSTERTTVGNRVRFAAVGVVVGGSEMGDFDRDELAGSSTSTTSWFSTLVHA
ncbi:hypothetical protein GGF31_008068, partial [Allomyces arbusculus]